MRHTLLLAFSLALACQRPEEPQSERRSEPPASHSAANVAAAPSAPLLLATASAPAATASSESAPAATASSKSAPAPCVVPLAEPPPPRAEPANICPKDPGPAPKLARGAVRFKEAPGAPRIQVERALTPAEHERGLMYRTKLADHHGMLFEWKDETRRVFWMHNTCIPLDMLFIAKDGTIAGILEQVPVLNDRPRGVPCNAGYVLEVNAGWCRRHSIKPGTHVTFE